MFRFQWKRLYKNKAIVIAFILYMIYIGYLVGVNYNSSDPTMLINTIMMQVSLTFLLFECTTFTFFSKTTSEVREIDRGSGKGIQKDYLSGIVIWAMIDFAITFLFGLLWYTCIHGGNMPVNDAFFVMLIKMLLIYHFLTYFFAILLGSVISFVPQKGKAYLALLGSYFLFSDVFLQMIGPIVETHPNLGRMPMFLSLMNRSWNDVLDGYYQYSVEPVNIERILFWNLMFITILAVFISHKYKKILFGICGIGLLVVTFLFVQPAGYHYEDSCVSAATEDEMYYHVLKEKNTGKDNHVSMADFKIKKYAGNLKVKRQLQAEIQIEPDEKKHDKYEFTLYHGFKVKQIADGNRILRFEQKGDHITIYVPGGLEQESITFIYQGYSSFYYSTSQATFLPAYFCYLPFPGHRLVWFEPSLMDNGMKDASKEDDLSGIGYEVEYDLLLDLSQKVYSNLSVDQKGHCRGKSDGLTLMASPYITEYTENGITFLYSIFRQNEISLKDQFKETATQLVMDGRTGTTVFVPPYLNRMIFFVGKDQVILEPDQLDNYYKKYMETGEIPYPEAEEEDYDFD